MTDPERAVVPDAAVEAALVEYARHSGRPNAKFSYTTFNRMRAALAAASPLMGGVVRTDPERAVIPDAAELLCCPFCGGEAKQYHRDDGYFGNTDWICCENEGCGCQTCLHETSASAIAAWNRRAAAGKADGE